MCALYFKTKHDVHEDILCVRSLPSNKSLNDYISGKLVILRWNTDGAASMTGLLSGLTTCVKELAPECASIHCVIHREMLASHKMSPELHSMLIDVVKTINRIKANPLNSHLFEQLFEMPFVTHQSQVALKEEILSKRL